MLYLVTKFSSELSSHFVFQPFNYFLHFGQLVSDSYARIFKLGVDYYRAVDKLAVQLNLEAQI